MASVFLCKDEPSIGKARSIPAVPVSIREGYCTQWITLDIGPRISVVISSVYVMASCRLPARETDATVRDSSGPYMYV